MKKISIGEFRRLNVAKIRSMLPFVVTIEGTEEFIAEKPDMALALSDLHPNVQRQLRAQYNKVRFAMPKPESILAEDVPEPE